MDPAKKEKVIFDMNEKQSSLLVRKIRDRLNALALNQARLVISVADSAQWEKSKLGDEVLVRWLCWSIESDGIEVSAPEFEILAAAITGKQLGEELPPLFPGVEVVVDNDIDVS